MKTLIAFFFCAASTFAQTMTIGTCAMSAGLSDATISGQYAPAAANAQYQFTFPSVGTPDHFQWSKNGGAFSSPIAMTGARQAFVDGLSIRFAATTGHTLNASCTVTATANGSLAASSFVQRGVGAIVRSAQDKVRDRPSILDFAKCDGSDEHVAIQNAINAHQQLDWTSGTSGVVCGTSVTITSAFDGQIFEGGGSVRSGNITGGSALRGVGSISGPVFVIVNYGVKMRGMVVDANGLASNAVVSECGSHASLDNDQLVNSTSDVLLFTNTTAPWTNCEGNNPSNDFFEIHNSIIAGSIGGRGINFTTASGDTNNNDILISNNFVTRNFMDGALMSGGEGRVIGGDYSNNGANSGSTQYYCIRVGNGGSGVQNAQHWIIEYPEVEACNFNTSTHTYRGPQIFMDGFSLQNKIYLPGPQGAAPNTVFCNTPGCLLYNIGDNEAHLLTPGGDLVIAGAGGGRTDPNYQLYDSSVSVTCPTFMIQGTAAPGWGGYSGNNLPVFCALAQTSFPPGVLQVGTNGEITEQYNTVSTYQSDSGGSPTLNADHVYGFEDSTAGAYTLFMHGVPFVGETHWIADIGHGGNALTVSCANGNTNTCNGSTTFTMSDGGWARVVWNGSEWKMFKTGSGFTGTQVITQCSTITGGVPTGCANVTNTYVNGLLQ